jgi:hypothetical protein
MQTVLKRSLNQDKHGRRSVHHPGTEAQRATRRVPPSLIDSNCDRRNGLMGSLGGVSCGYDENFPQTSFHSPSLFRVHVPVERPGSGRGD